MDLKEYKPLSLVFYIDWDWNRSALPLDEQKINEFKQAVETKKMIEIEWVVINTFDIKEIRPSSHTTELEKYFYSRTIQERALIKKWITRMVWSQKINIIEAISQMNDPIKRLERFLEWHRE